MKYKDEMFNYDIIIFKIKVYFQIDRGELWQIMNTHGTNSYR